MTPQEPAVADDASVILRSRHESEAFSALFTRHAPAIQRYVTRRLGLTRPMT
jgi:DNA-directed RNA polymerase specialized sigma24 family protein